MGSLLSLPPFVAGGHGDLYHPAVDAISQAGCKDPGQVAQGAGRPDLWSGNAETGRADGDRNLYPFLSAAAFVLAEHSAHCASCLASGGHHRQLSLWNLHPGGYGSHVVSRLDHAAGTELYAPAFLCHPCPAGCVSCHGDGGGRPEARLASTAQMPAVYRLPCGAGLSV